MVTVVPLEKRSKTSVNFDVFNVKPSVKTFPLSTFPENSCPFGINALAIPVTFRTITEPDLPISAERILKKVKKNTIYFTLKNIL